LIAAIFDASFPWPLFLIAFFVGGLVKGALGVGLPLVTTPLLGLGLGDRKFNRTKPSMARVLDLETHLAKAA